MLLAMNIGNMHITLGCYEGEQLIASSYFSTEKHFSEDQYAAQIRSILKLYDVNCEEIDGAIISCVVPELALVIKHAIKKLFNIRVLIVGPGVKSGLNILIDNPAQLGADLVACSVAAINKYPLPCIIVCFEIATSICVIDENGNFVGSIISAGVDSSLKALADGAALLTHVSVETPPNVVGRNSIHSMQSGLVHGTASMIDGLILRIKKEFKNFEEPSLLATGTFSQNIIKECFNDIAICDDLILDGLRMIYYKNIK